MAAEIVWEGKTYKYDPEHLDVKTAMVIKMHTGYGLKSWSRAVDDMEPAAVQALLWAVKQQNGEACEVASLNFDIPVFMRVVNDALNDWVAARAQASIGRTDPTPRRRSKRPRAADANTPEPTPTLSD